MRAFGRRSLFPEALDGVEWYQGDFCDPASLAAAIETYEIVFHLVHTSTPYSANLEMAKDLQQNVAASLALFDVSRVLEVQRIVFVSTGGTVYGFPEQIPTPETAPTHPITAYGISKLAIEKYLAVYERLYGLQYRILRIANPFGPFRSRSRIKASSPCSSRAHSMAKPSISGAMARLRGTIFSLSTSLMPWKPAASVFRFSRRYNVLGPLRGPASRH